MGKAAIYARVSSLDTKQDYNRQIDELTAIIKQQGYSAADIDVYAEHISGFKKNDERLILSELLEKIESNPTEYDCVYTSEISRIGRNPNHTRQIIDRWTELGVPLFIQSLNERTINSSGKRNATMNIVLQVLMEYANIEAETFKTRSKSGLRASASKGKVGGGRNHPYGYKADENGYLVVDEGEKEVIIQIFDLYIEGNGTKVISGILNHKLIPTRANKAFSNQEIKFKNFKKLGSKVSWSDKQIHDIITNTIYKGERKFKGEVFAAPAIISPSTFDKCTEIRLSKTHRNYLTKYDYLLKDIIVCGNCGRNYFAKYKPVDGGDKVYICSSRLKSKGNCGNYGVNITLVESAIFNVVFDNDLILKYINNSDKLVLKLKAELKQLTGKLPIEEKELIKLTESNHRLSDLYIAKGEVFMPTEEYYQRKEEILSKIAATTDRINLLKRQITEKGESLNKFTTVKATKTTLIKAKSNRADLQILYGQFISKAVVEKYEPNNVIIGVYMQINGVKLPNPLLVMLDLSSVRKKPITYRYKVIYNNDEVGEEGDVFELSDFDTIGWAEIPKNELIEL